MSLSFLPKGVVVGSTTKFFFKKTIDKSVVMCYNSIVSLKK